MNVFGISYGYNLDHEHLPYLQLYHCSGQVFRLYILFYQSPENKRQLQHLHHLLQLDKSCRSKARIVGKLIHRQ